MPKPEETDSPPVSWSEVTTINVSSNNVSMAAIDSTVSLNAMVSYINRSVSFA